MRRGAAGGLFINSLPQVEWKRAARREVEEKKRRKGWTGLSYYLLPNRYPVALINYDIAQAGASARY